MDGTLDIKYLSAWIQLFNIKAMDNTLSLFMLCRDDVNASVQMPERDRNRCC